MSDAAALMRGLGLTIAAGGPNGRYPRSHEGPAQGYRWWAHAIDGEYRFGVQPSPKMELSSPVASAFTAAGFQLMPKRTEAFMNLSGPLDHAVDQGRVVMAQCEHILARAR